MPEQVEAVVCLEVLVHYPQPAFERLAGRLARQSNGPLLLTYAPRTPVQWRTTP